MATALPQPHGRIRLLPTGLVNRIAAGEVIERPAAAVKELVENALDAGAQRIAVSLQGGGIERIEVADDGCGMDAADLALAVQRHCTSKLADESLVRITTLGFRGEALPSIGAAARLHITSRPHGAAHAHLIRVEGGLVQDPQPAPGPPGTRVVASDLFFATPARRKFLKHPRTEGEHAEQAVRRLALAAPGVAFRCELEGRTAFDLPAQDRAARVAALLGPDAAAALLPVAEERGGMRISGFACLPTINRATAAAQGFVVNGRPVADPGAAYGAAGGLPRRDRRRAAPRRGAIPGPASGRAGRERASGQAGAALPRPGRGARPGDRRSVPRAGGRSRGARRGKAALASGVSQLQGRPGRGGPRYEGFAEAQLPLAASPAARVLPESMPAPSHPLGAAMAQVLDTYILAVAADGGLVLVDQHAAHERLTHEALREQHEAGGVRAQPLLLPAVVDLPPADAARLLDHADALRALGLELEGFGPGAVLVRALPAALGAPDPAPLLRDLADELAEGGEAVALAARMDAVLARLACHGSIRAGRRMLQPEMDALLRQMETTPRAATCSHGRPTFLKLSRADLERMFGRR